MLIDKVDFNPYTANFHPGNAYVRGYFSHLAKQHNPFR